MRFVLKTTLSYFEFNNRLHLFYAFQFKFDNFVKLINQINFIGFLCLLIIVLNQ